MTVKKSSDNVECNENLAAFTRWIDQVLKTIRENEETRERCIRVWLASINRQIQVS